MYPETKTIGSNGTGDSRQVVECPGAYPFPLDAVVLAGTHNNPKRLICGRNKAFLKIHGQALIRYVVDALVEAENIDRVFVVGPEDRLHEALDGVSPTVSVVAQRGKMLTNTWAGITASEQRHVAEDNIPVEERPLLVVSCDIPLITSEAVDDFVTRCARVDAQSTPAAAMLVGVVDEPGVTPFHPDENNDGIERPFVELDFGRLRLANIYVARPRQLAHQEFLQTGFSYRKAKDWHNVVKLFFSFLKTPGGWHASRLTARVQFTLMASKRWQWLYRKLRAGNSRERVEKSISDVLGGPVKVVITPFGGLSLDVDDTDDFRMLDKRYTDWAAITAATKPEN